MDDFKGAARTYAEAVRQGGAGSGIMSMDFDFASQPGRPEMLMSMDVNEDAIVIVNAEGQILLISQGITPLFGYEKAELEGQNISMLMPQPFSGRHNSYLQHYKETQEARILERVNELVGLSKDKKVFPREFPLSTCGDSSSSCICSCVMAAFRLPSPHTHSLCSHGLCDQAQRRWRRRGLPGHDASYAVQQERHQVLDFTQRRHPYVLPDVQRAHWDHGCVEARGGEKAVLYSGIGQHVNGSLFVICEILFR